MDLSTMPLADLRQLRDQLDKELPRRERQEKEQAIEQIYRIAHNLGMPLATLLTHKPKKEPTAEIQFRDPANSDNEWTGRGPRPRWLKQALASGAKLDDFRVTDGSHPSTDAVGASQTA